MKKRYGKGGIYCITNIINNKKYIGYAVNFLDRWNKHRECLNQNLNKPNSHLQGSWNKYGENAFTFEVLEELNPNLFTRVLFEKVEGAWCKWFKTYKKEFGYNMYVPGEKYNIRDISEYRVRKSTARKSRPIYQIDTNTNKILKEWESVSVVCKELNLSKDKLYGTLINKSYCKRQKQCLSHKGFVWCYVDSYDENKDYRPKKNRKMKANTGNFKDSNPSKIKKPLVLINVETQEIKNFHSYAEASRYLKVDKTVINALARGFRKNKSGSITKIEECKGWKIHTEKIVS